MMPLSLIKRQFYLLPIAIALIFSGQMAAAQDFPELTGRVVDEADLLSPAEEADLTLKLEALETATQRQLVVATMNDLQGYDIADYGYQLGREWGLGDEERNDGALLIIAPNERKMRIEVGYGLEGTLTDGLSSQIIRNDITPQFKQGNFPAGINAGVDRIVSILQLPPEEAAKLAADVERQQRHSGDDISVAGVIFWLFIFFFIIMPIVYSFSRGGRKYRRGGSGPVIIWGGGNWGHSSGHSSWGGGSSWSGGGGFSGGGGSFGGGGASGGW